MLFELWHSVKVITNEDVTSLESSAAGLSVGFTSIWKLLTLYPIKLQTVLLKHEFQSDTKAYHGTTQKKALLETTQLGSSKKPVLEYGYTFFLKKSQFPMYSQWRNFVLMPLLD